MHDGQLTKVPNGQFT